MARPRKQPEQRRRHVVNIRLTDAELAQLKDQAAAAGLPYGRYAREAVLGKKPRARPAKTIIFQKLIYELQSVATNFQQLADATGDDVYINWARYVGGQLVEQLIGRDDLADLVEQQIEPLNTVGHLVNGLAHQANSGKDVSDEMRDEAFAAVRAALEPLHEASAKPEPSSGRTKPSADEARKSSLPQPPGRER